MWAQTSESNVFCILTIRFFYSSAQMSIIDTPNALWAALEFSLVALKLDPQQEAVSEAQQSKTQEKQLIHV